MVMAIFYAPKAGIDRERIASWAVEWMDSNLSASDHVLVEFKVPGERQVDFLILREDGAYCIEVKHKPYQKVSVNGPWVYRDGRTGSLIDDISSFNENPYNQATNTADGLRRWISRTEITKAVFLDRKAEPKRDNYGKIEFFKVYPIVLIPDTPQLKDPQRDSHCELCNGPAQLKGCFARKHWKPSFRLSIEEIARFIQALDMDRVSVLALADQSSKGLPPSIAGYEEYCCKLIADLNAKEPCSDFYVPNTVREIKEEYHSGKSFSRSQPDIKIDATSDFIPAQLPKGRILLQAEGGVGKTTFCNYICRKAAHEKLTDPSAPLPIYVELTDYRPQSGDLLDLLATSMRLYDLNIRDVKESSFQQANLLILLDGINEIDEQDYPRFLADVRKWLPQFSRTVVFFTTRTTDRRELSLPELRKFEIQQFDENQIRIYLEKRDRTELLEAIIAADASELLQKPLLLSLALKLDRSYPLTREGGGAGFYRALLQELLKRELAKANKASDFDILWEDLCELANKLSTQPGGSRPELSQSEANNFMCDRHFDPVPEHSAEWLRLLSSAGILQKDRQRDTVNFCHRLILSFFYAVWLTDPARMSQLDKRLSEYTGQYCIALDVPGYSSCFLYRASLRWQDTLRFAFELLLGRSQEFTERNRLKHLFYTDPFMALECKHLFDAKEFEILLNSCLGVSVCGEPTAFSPYIFQPQCSLIGRHMEDSDGHSRLEPCQAANAPALIADEVAFRLVVNYCLKNQAPRLLERLCRTMPSKGIPYCASGEVRAWGEHRFDALMNLCPPADLVEIFHRICRDGTIQECRNAAVIFNYLTLQGFFEGMEETFVNVIDEGSDESLRYEVVDSWDAFQDTLPRLKLMKVYYETLDDPMLSRQLEAELRVLSIFESCFVVQPLVESFGRSREESREMEVNPAKAELYLLVRKIIDLIGTNPCNALPPELEDFRAMVVFRNWHGINCEITSDAYLDSEEIGLIKWGFAVLAPRANQMRQNLVNMLDDATQAHEAAEAIVRLKLEGLWQHDACFWKRIGDVDRNISSFVGKGENQSEQRDWSDRPLSVFLDALPLQPYDFRNPEDRICLELELSMGGPPEFLRAARLLLESA
jgi:hypothetical protein